MCAKAPIMQTRTHSTSPFSSYNGINSIECNIYASDIAVFVRYRPKYYNINALLISFVYYCIIYNQCRDMKRIWITITNNRKMAH